MSIRYFRKEKKEIPRTGRGFCEMNDSKKPSPDERREAHVSRLLMREKAVKMAWHGYNATEIAAYAGIPMSMANNYHISDIPECPDSIAPYFPNQLSHAVERFIEKKLGMRRYSLKAPLLADLKLAIESDPDWRDDMLNTYGCGLIGLEVIEEFCKLKGIRIDP